jgi:hypothetical protein
LKRKINVKSLFGKNNVKKMLFYEDLRVFCLFGGEGQIFQAARAAHHKRRKVLVNIE